MVRLANGSRSGPFPAGRGATAENLTLPAGLIGGFNAYYNRTVAYLEGNSTPSFFTVARSINPVASGTPASPFGTGQNSDLRYLEAGTRVMRFRDIAPPFGTGPVGLPLWIEPGVSNNAVYDWSWVNVIAPNYGNDKARTYVLEAEHTAFNTPSHLLAVRAGLFVQKFDRNRYILMENQDTFINIDEFTEGRLKNFDLGTAVRWESKASIGYLAGPAETTGVFQGAVLFLDNNRPVYDKSRAYFDFNAGYRFRFLSDKVRTKVQLNVRNAFEGGRLQAIAVNPDGVPYAYRIIEPRQFILSASFDL